MTTDTDDGRCPHCDEDEMDGARCQYCGFHLYDCEMPDCQWCEQYRAGKNPSKSAVTSTSPTDTDSSRGGNELARRLAAFVDAPDAKTLTIVKDGDALLINTWTADLRAQQFAALSPAQSEAGEREMREEVERDVALLGVLYTFLRECWKGTGRSFEEGSASNDYREWSERVHIRWNNARKTLKGSTPPTASEAATAPESDATATSERELQRYRHNARDTEYDLIGTAELQDAKGEGVEEGALLAIYRGDDGKLWARRHSEFGDGRFTRIDRALASAKPQAGDEPLEGCMSGWEAAPHAASADALDPATVEALLQKLGDGHEAKLLEYKNGGYGSGRLFDDFDDPGEVGFDAGWDAAKKAFASLSHPAPTNMQVAAHPIIREIMAEVEKATRKFPTWPTRIIEAGNVLSEEAGEVAKAILQCVYEPHKSGLGDVREEVVQTAAMCFRFLASMGRYDLSEGPQHHQDPLPKSDCLQCGNNPAAIELCDNCERTFISTITASSTTEVASMPPRAEDVREAEADCERLRAVLCAIVDAVNNEDSEAMTDAMDDARGELVVSALRVAKLNDARTMSLPASEPDAQGERAELVELEEAAIDLWEQSPDIAAIDPRVRADWSEVSERSRIYWRGKALTAALLAKEQSK